MKIDNNIDKSYGKKKLSSNFKVSWTRFDSFLSYMFQFVSTCYFILLTYISSSRKEHLVFCLCKINSLINGPYITININKCYHLWDSQFFHYQNDIEIMSIVFP
jgi:hypothetical protein